MPKKHKAEVPCSDADLNAYDVIYYGGHSNPGGKTIAINLPSTEQVQLEKGTRRLQLKVLCVPSLILLCYRLPTP